jgi:hypothetical protein
VSCIVLEVSVVVKSTYELLPILYFFCENFGVNDVVQCSDSI